jgi:hypothetical protein
MGGSAGAGAGIGAGAVCASGAIAIAVGAVLAETVAGVGAVIAADSARMRAMSA